ncbi:uncharacterized protein LOC590005 [Strongylocentrotus purpuratus]|uniref:Ig-like domain-containing protein n=1 Tax=Strongylocentrotus purpuratus TaxID=7668 RepID=A0A7M7RE67_STRPU|nr:uncharacterized protein LOC590005 [Strongylocentrotus purpuratus]
MFDIISHVWTNMAHPKGFLAVVLLTYCLCLSDVAAVSRTVVFQGDSAELECQVDDAVITIVWRKGDDIDRATTVASFVDGVRQGSDGGRISMSSSRSLVINDVDIADESMYYCIVTLTSSSNDIVIEAQLEVAVPPAEPYPTIVLLQPTSSPSANASCQYTIPQGTQYRLSCEVDSFRPSVELVWFVNDVSEGGAPLKFADNPDGTRDVYGSLDVTMGVSNMDVRCEVSGEAVPDPPRIITALVCWAPSTSGGSNTTTIIVVVVIVIVLIAVVVGIALWMKILIRDTMVRSNYSKTASADDDTPSRSRMSNFCHICCATCCPCTVREDEIDAETQRRKGASSSHSKEERAKKAPSAALKARIQQNRKKQEGRSGAAAESNHVPSDKPTEHSPMLENPDETSTPMNPKPPGARPKTRPIDDASVVIRVPHQAPQSVVETNGTAAGEAETGF